MRCQTGVSLIETLIAMGLAGLLLTLAVPAFTGLQARRAADAALAALASDFALARSEAIKRGHSVTICSSADGLSCLASSTPSATSPSPSPNDWRLGWIIYEPVGTATATPTLKVLRVQGPPTGILSIISTDRAITFRPTGIGQASAGNMKVTPQADGAAMRLLCISAAGRMRVAEVGSVSC